jgi:hypothetical protein
VGLSARNNRINMERLARLQKEIARLREVLYVPGVSASPGLG